MNRWIHAISTSSSVEGYGDHHGRSDLPPRVLARPSFRGRGGKVARTHSGPLVSVDVNFPIPAASTGMKGPVQSSLEINMVSRDCLRSPGKLQGDRISIKIELVALVETLHRVILIFSEVSKGSHYTADN